MKSVDEQLIAVLKIIEGQARLNPKGKTFAIHSYLFDECPDHASLFSKLEEEFDVIEIKQRPDSRGLGHADHDMFEFEMPNEYREYMSYYVNLLPPFTTFYETEYVKHRFSIRNLTSNNRTLVTKVMQAIDDEVSLSGSTQVQIDPIESEDLSIKALAFLKKVGAIQSYEAVDEIDFNGEYERMMPTGQIDFFKVNLDLPVFDEKWALLKMESAPSEIEPSSDILKLEDTKIKTEGLKSSIPQTLRSATTLYALQPEHYEKAKGVLHLSPEIVVTIAKRGNPKKKDGKKYEECRLLDCVFKSVNTLSMGVDFSKILAVSNAKITVSEERKVRNLVDSINSKVEDAKGPKKLLKIQKKKVFLNNSYL